VIEPYDKAEVVALDAYPGYMSSVYKPRGYLMQRDTLTGLSITGVLTGLEPNVQAGWHVHEGYSCADAASPGGHYFVGLDPWLSTSYVTDTMGVSYFNASMEEFSVYPSKGSAALPVFMRTVVIHLSSAQAKARASCGHQAFIVPKPPPAPPTPLTPPSLPSEQLEDSESGMSSSTSMIAGSATAVVLALVSVGVIVFCCRSKSMCCFAPKAPAGARGPKIHTGNNKDIDMHVHSKLKPNQA